VLLVLGRYQVNFLGYEPPIEERKPEKRKCKSFYKSELGYTIIIKKSITANTF